MLRSALRLLLLPALFLAAALCFCLSMYPGQPREGAEGLSTRVDVRRGDRWDLAGGSKATLPLNRDLRSLAAHLDGPPFRIVWTGTFLAERSGVHQINMASDDGSRLWVDGTLVIDNGGLHPRRWRSGLIGLAPGLHEIRVEYEQWGGESHLDTWLRQPGGLARRLDAVRRQFAPGRLSSSQQWARIARDWLPWLAVGSAMAAYLTLLCGAGHVLFRHVERLAGSPPADWRLGLTLACVTVPLTAGLLWGLPADIDTWAPDELTPVRLVEALDRRFVAPWTSIYPPLHFYILAPLAVAANTFANVDGWSAAVYPGGYLVHAAMRGVSVLMALGALAWLYVLVRLHGSRAQALASVAAGAASSGFLYYGKTANVDVPYLYWMLCACTCVAAVAKTWRPQLVLIAAVTGACAVGTKDQATGFLLLFPLWLFYIRRRHLQRSDGNASLWTVLADPVWLKAGAAAIVTLSLIYLVPVSPDGALRHFEAARRGTYSPMVPNTVLGHLRLFAMQLELLSFMMGIPMAAAAVAGLVYVHRQMPALGVAIAVPIVSYVGLLLPLIRYTYDRFLLGAALLLACAVGPVCVAAWRQQRWRPAVAVLGLLAGAYTVGHAVGATAIMTRDSRYDAERALDTRNAARRELVGLLSPRMYLPRAGQTPVVDLEATIEEVREWSPDVLLFNRTWLERFRPTDTEGAALREAIDTGRLGYRHVATWHTPAPWWAFQMRPRYLRHYSRFGLTNLDKINPRLEMWQRDDVQPR